MKVPNKKRNIFTRSSINLTTNLYFFYMKGRHFKKFLYFCTLVIKYNTSNSWTKRRIKRY